MQSRKHKKEHWAEHADFVFDMVGRVISRAAAMSRMWERFVSQSSFYCCEKAKNFT